MAHGALGHRHNTGLSVNSRARHALPSATASSACASTRRHRVSVWLRPLSSTPGLLEHLLDALLASDIPVEAGLLLLAPLLHLLDRGLASLLILHVPIIECLHGLVLALVDAEEELLAKGIDGLGLVELAGDPPAVLKLTLLGVLRELGPELLEHISLGLARLILLRQEELLQVVCVFLNLVPGLNVIVNQPLHYPGLELLQVRVRPLLCCLLTLLL